MGILERTVNLFPAWAVLFSALAWYFPEAFAAGKPAIVPLLGVVMFGMGVTLTADEFRQVARRPRLVAAGTAMQYALMPFAAWAVSKAFGLPPLLAAGMVVVGSCPGGTASNVVCYLARGDVALSITLTFVSTLLAVALTPALTWLYVGQSVPVPALSMMWSVFKIVIIPVSLGVAVNTMWGRRLGGIKHVFPLVSVMAIVLIIAIIVGLNRDKVGLLGPALALCVILHNAIGLAGGYWLSRALAFSKTEARTISIEVGMQNSGLGVALALKYFGAAAALPGAIFSVWHNLSGSVLASYWAGKGRADK